jgi:mRNA-degrading endonuclease YafQ of YafQ-DinJ toxin-antitoxin module
LTTTSPKNVRTRQFKELFSNLPEHVQKLSKLAFKQFVNDPTHPALRRHHLKSKKTAEHWDGSYSVSVTMQYRSIYAVRNGCNVWYWTGSHSDYNRFIGSSE